MKKFLVGLLLGLLVGGGLMYFLPVLKTEVSTEIPKENNDDSSTYFTAKHLKDCGVLLDFATQSWFTEFFAASIESKMISFAISDACYLKDQNAFVFIYWDPTESANAPGYGTAHGIYKYDILTEELAVATYLNTGDMNTFYNLAVVFSDKKEAGKLRFHGGPIAWGCEPDDLNPDDPCCGPGDLYYEYDVAKNEVKYLYAGAVYNTDPVCHKNDVVNEDGVTVQKP